MSENSIFKTTWQLYKEIELHVGRLCTMDYAIVVQSFLFHYVSVPKTRKKFDYAFAFD